ncbi:unnamed protein product [Toxocara canis]|uniref:Amiloride-sensitive sodium channel n=1 Tax=Toxocara canis TaxID=6265 RepID=A0A183UUC7_TOXCA|nr:unnamed protein product [Toxocara canis]
MPRAADRIATHLNFLRIDDPPRRNYMVMRKREESEPSALLTSKGWGIAGGPRSSSIDAVVSVVTDDEGNVVLEKEPIMLSILESANVDGTRHLRSPSKATRYAWAAIIVIFMFLAALQIWSQIAMYITTPVATNIEAYYPDKFAFPAVAICNNNQFRLTYLTGPIIRNRRTKDRNKTIAELEMVNSTMFDKVLEKTWDMDAVKFLRSAAHWKSRMILRCTWPNGTSCRLSDFRAVWTLTGLCWAINTDPQNPHYISSSGSSHGLRLLLNIERYERVESCTPNFRTMSLPGLKVLIYNQTDMPESSLNGVNVPPGYSMDIPFRIQHRSKVPGMGCVQTNEEQQLEPLPFDHPRNVHSCLIRNFLVEIEKRCNCSMRRAYSLDASRVYRFCNVEQYFDCVLPLMKGRSDAELDKFECIPGCEQIDYIAWQDMNLLPSSIFPSLIDTAEEEDIDDVIDDYDSEEESNYLDHVSKDELFQCEESQLLSEDQVRQIKRSAQRAYEKQSRYQEDIQLRTKRLIQKLRNATQNLIRLGWGWSDKNYVGAYHRLNASLTCYSSMAEVHTEMVTALNDASVPSEEIRTSNIFRLISPSEHKLNPERYKTLTELRQVYGERVDDVIKDFQTIANIIDGFWKIYKKETFTSTLGVNLDRMDKGWYNPTLKDFDQSLVRNIINIEENDLPYLLNAIHNGTGLKTGAVLYFGDTSKEHMEQFSGFVNDIVQCTMNDVKNESTTLLKTFKKAMNEFQSAYTNLFKKELPTYLTNFDFSRTQNFAMVNVFLHKMNVEIWRQEGDVGGALGLFLGASMLTIIELLYLCFHYVLADKNCERCTTPKKMCPENVKIIDPFQKWKGKMKDVDLTSRAGQLETALMDSSLSMLNSMESRTSRTTNSVKVYPTRSVQRSISAVRDNALRKRLLEPEESISTAEDMQSLDSGSDSRYTSKKQTLSLAPLENIDERSSLADESSAIRSYITGSEGSHTAFHSQHASIADSVSSSVDQPALFVPKSERQTVV